MRIHRVRLANYRGVSGCTVEFPDNGVTVIEGDNEVGKTSIPEAVKLILTELDSSGKRPVRAIRPVHRDEGPEVEVEITSGDYRFTYFKRWHRGPQTTLEITAPKPEQRTGREAHTRVEAILEETLDSDLWKALNIEQGTELGLPNFDVFSLGRALEQAAGGQGASPGDDALWERICAERREYWTGTGKPNQEQKSLTAAVDAARDRKDELDRQVRAVEDDAQKAQLLADAAVDLAARRDKSDVDEKELSEQWNASVKLLENVERLAARHDAASARRNEAANNHEARNVRLDEVNASRENLAALEAEVEQAAPLHAAAVERKQETNDALVAAREALSVAQDDNDLARSDSAYYRRLFDLDQLSARHERVVAAEQDLKSAETVLDSAQVDDELVSAIEQSNLKVASADAALRGSATVVEIAALTALRPRIDGTEVDLEAGDAHETEVIDSWELLVPDVVQVRMRAGSGSSDLSAELQAARREHDRLCAQGGVKNLAEARQAAERRKEAERRQKEARATIERDLQDLTPVVLADKVRGLTERTAEYADDRQESPPLPDSFDDAKQLASQTEERLNEARNEFTRCEQDHAKAADDLQEAERNAAVDVEKLNNARIALAQNETKLVEDRRQQSDQDLEEAMVSAQSEVDEAADSLAQAEREHQALDPDSIKAKLDNARDVKTRLEKDLDENRRRRDELRGRLEAQGESGLHSQLNDAESQYEQLVRHQQGNDARAAAADLLYRIFERHRHDARLRYVKPFKEQIEQLGRIVFGRTFEVELDDDLRVARRTMDGITLELGQLSVGAREQLGVICRLACAAIVSPDGGGAPVVIDDALGWSDPGRLQSMGAAIAAAGRDCQVIVLTCTPGRYANVGNAKVVRVPETSAD